MKNQPKEEIKSFHKFIQKMIFEFIDAINFSDIVTGDRVTVWNWVGFTDLEQNMIRPINKPKYFVVTAIAQDALYAFDDRISFKVKQDLIIGNPDTGQEYRIPGTDVKLYNS